MKSIIVILVAGALAGCGVMGTPVPPEDVGVTPLILQQKRADAQASKPQGEERPTLLEPQGQDVELPPLRPVGTR